MRLGPSFAKVCELRCWLVPPEAAELIVQRIVSHANHSGIPLTEVERKMLLFSDTSPTLPDISGLNEEFERDYDSAQYERKISDLIRDVRSCERQNSEANQSWNDAVRSLRDQDYYFMIMLNEATRHERQPGDLFRLLMTAMVIVCTILGIAWFFTSQ